MIVASLREGDDLVDLLLRKDADVNIKSSVPMLLPAQSMAF